MSILTPAKIENCKTITLGHKFIINEGRSVEPDFGSNGIFTTGSKLLKQSSSLSTSLPMNIVNKINLLTIVLE
jgi:hypothetical protein